MRPDVIPEPYTPAGDDLVTLCGGLSPGARRPLRFCFPVTDDKREAQGSQSRPFAVERSLKAAHAAAHPLAFGMARAVEALAIAPDGGTSAGPTSRREHRRARHQSADTATARITGAEVQPVT